MSKKSTLLNLHSTTLMTAEKRKKWFALQYTLGFKKSQVVFCYLLEIAITVLRGFVYGIVGVFAYKAFVTLFALIFFLLLIISINIVSKINKIDIVKTLS